VYWTQSLSRRNSRALIAKTVKGKGVPFMEHNNIWHYTRLNSETYVQAVTAVMKADQWEMHSVQIWVAI
jgi:transketolase